MKTNCFLFVMAAIFVTPTLDLPAAKPAAETPKKPVSTKYQGVTVDDPYQWLQKDDEPDVKTWSDAQNQRTRQYLDQLPDRGAIEKQLTEWYAKTSPGYSSLVSRPGLLFVMKFQPPKQQPLLVTLTSANDLKSEKVVLDPNVLDAKGTTAIDWFVPSLDGKYVACPFPKVGVKTASFPFTRPPPAARCRTVSPMSNIRRRAEAQHGTPTAPESITHAFPEQVSGPKLT